MENLESILSENPIIAAVKDEDGLEKALLTDCRIIFLLCGNVCSVGGLVDRIKSSGKLAMVHIDLIDGLSSKDVAVAFLRQNTQADGVISTKPAIVKAAKEQGLLAIQRFFLIDSLALANFQKYTEAQVADAIEILPATMPKIVRRITTSCRLPVIAGGLISDKEDILLALQNGAAAISSTNQDVWTM